MSMKFILVSKTHVHYSTFYSLMGGNTNNNTNKNNNNNNIFI